MFMSHFIVTYVIQGAGSILVRILKAETWKKKVILKSQTASYVNGKQISMATNKSSLLFGILSLDIRTNVSIMS